MTTRTMTLKPVFARKTKKSPAFLGRRLVIPSDTPASVTLDEASASAPAAQPRRRFRVFSGALWPWFLAMLATARRRTHILTVRSRSTSSSRIA